MAADFSADLRLKTLLQRVAVPVPAPLEHVYATFNTLLRELLLRDVPDRLAMVARLEAELAAPDMNRLVRRWAMDFEFRWFLAGVAWYRAAAVGSPTLAWGATTVSNEWLARAAVLRAIDWLDQGSASSYAPKRGRGRPPKPEVDLHIELILRERLYIGGRTMRQAALQIAKYLPTPWKPSHFYERVKRSAQRDVPVPAAWRSSAWRERLSPLRSIDFLRLGEKRRRDAEAVRKHRENTRRPRPKKRS